MQVVTTLSEVSGSIYVAVNISGYMASDGRVTDELERIRKESVVA
jgi:hypothetical protein